MTATGGASPEAFLARIPPDGSAPRDVPAAVNTLAAGQSLRAVWENEVGGRTFEIGSGPERRFVKWAPTASGIDLGREAERLGWAMRFTTVPRVLGQGRDEGGTWLMTAAIAGESAVSERWLADPARAVAAIGAGLRAFHDALPVAQCPFSWSLETRLADIRRRAPQMDPGRWHESHQALGLPGALARLNTPPPVDRMVVCQGDACAPNTLIGEDGGCTGHVDLGALGVADRWADLAIATWSTEWNYGPGWEEQLLRAYGVAPDPVRTAYYRLLWDLGP
jgi:kanamycin kinase